MAAAVDGSALLWMALLLFSPDGMLMAPQKSEISLSPPWNRLLEGDTVTLTCNRKYPTNNNPTTWFYNNTNFSTTTSNYIIVNAKLHHNGTYECQNHNLSKSKPVHLEVLKDWLILQTAPEVVLEGRSLSLKCHAWKNWTVYSVKYYKDNQTLSFSYENKNPIKIKTMTLNDSGAYYCTGFFTIKQKRENKIQTSESLNITVIKAQQSKYTWLQFIIPLVVVTLLVADTGLFVSTEKQFKSLLMMKMTDKGNKLQNPSPVADPKGK